MKTNATAVLALVFLLSSGSAAGAGLTCDQVSKAVARSFDGAVNGFFVGGLAARFQKSLFGQRAWLTFAPPSVEVAVRPAETRVDFTITLQPARLTAGVNVRRAAGREQRGGTLSYPREGKSYALSVQCPADPAKVRKAQGDWAALVQRILEDAGRGLGELGGSAAVDGLTVALTAPRLTVSRRGDTLTASLPQWGPDSIRYHGFVFNAPPATRVAARSATLTPPLGAGGAQERDAEASPCTEGDAYGAIADFPLFTGRPQTLLQRIANFFGGLYAMIDGRWSNYQHAGPFAKGIYVLPPDAAVGAGEVKYLDRDGNWIRRTRPPVCYRALAYGPATLAPELPDPVLAYRHLNKKEAYDLGEISGGAMKMLEPLLGMPLGDIPGYLKGKCKLVDQTIEKAYDDLLRDPATTECRAACRVRATSVRMCDVCERVCAYGSCTTLGDCDSKVACVPPGTTFDDSKFRRCVQTDCRKLETVKVKVCGR